MKFFNGMTLEAIVDKEVDVYVTNETETCQHFSFCQTYLENGTLWLDCMPAIKRKYVVQVPNEAAVSRNDDALEVGRYAIFLPERTAAAKYIHDIFSAKDACHRFAEEVRASNRVWSLGNAEGRIASTKVNGLGCLVLFSSKELAESAVAAWSENSETHWFTAENLKPNLERFAKLGINDVLLNPTVNDAKPVVFSSLGLYMAIRHGDTEIMRTTITLERSVTESYFGSLDQGIDLGPLSPSQTLMLAGVVLCCALRHKPHWERGDAFPAIRHQAENVAQHCHQSKSVAADSFPKIEAKHLGMSNISNVVGYIVWHAAERETEEREIAPEKSWEVVLNLLALLERAAEFAMKIDQKMEVDEKETCIAIDRTLVRTGRN